MLSLALAAACAGGAGAATERPLPRRFHRKRGIIPQTGSRWDGLAAQLDAWPLSGDGGFGFTVGDSSGTLFEYSR